MDNYIIACFVFSLCNLLFLAGIFIFSYLRYCDTDRLKELERLERIRKTKSYFIDRGHDEIRAYQSAVAIVDLLDEKSKK